MLHFCFLSSFMILSFGCKTQPETEAIPSITIGVWEVTGDNRIIWTPDFETDIHITFEYLATNDFYSYPRIRIDLTDSSNTISGYENLDIFNMEHQFVIPESFDLLSGKSNSGFESTSGVFKYYSVHKVNCKKNSSADQLAYEMYTGKYSSDKFSYTFDSEGIGTAIKHLACPK